jgi:hypothetical protein
MHHFSEEAHQNFRWFPHPRFLDCPPTFSDCQCPTPRRGHHRASLRKRDTTTAGDGDLVVRAGPDGRQVCDGASSISGPRCSVIFSFDAVSSTFLVNCLSSSSAPVKTTPAHGPGAPAPWRPVSSADGSGFFLPVTASGVVTHGTFPADPTSARRAGNTVYCTVPSGQVGSWV